jgi:hypothetical protein
MAAPKYVSLAYNLLHEYKHLYSSNKISYLSYELRT